MLLSEIVGGLTVFKKCGITSVNKDTIAIKTRPCSFAGYENKMYKLIVLMIRLLSVLNCHVQAQGKGHVKTELGEYLLCAGGFFSSESPDKVVSFLCGTSLRYPLIQDLSPQRKNTLLLCELRQEQS